MHCEKSGVALMKTLPKTLDTGEIFTSIKAAHASVTVPISVQMFYRKLRRDQQVTLSNGTRYEFVVPPKERDSEELYSEYFYSDVADSNPTPDQLAVPLSTLEEAVEIVPTKSK